MSTNLGFQNLETEEVEELKIGDRIAIILAKRGMSQRELAQKINATDVSVSRYINNIRVPKATTLLDIANALDVSPDVLLGISPDKPKLIHCKDCKWWDVIGNRMGYCYAVKHNYYSRNWEINIVRKYPGDFYCADAEPKECEDGN